MSEPAGPPVVADEGLLVENRAQVCKADGRFADTLGSLVPDGAQGLDAAGVDALDGADEAQLAVEGREHGVLLMLGGRQRQGGEA